MNEMEKLADRLDPHKQVGWERLPHDKGRPTFRTLIEAATALRQHATALEIGRGIVPFPRDELLRLIRKHFNDRSRGALIFSRWEDGIDIDQTTYAAEVLADDIARAVLASLGIKNG